MQTVAQMMADLKGTIGADTGAFHRPVAVNVLARPVERGGDARRDTEHVFFRVKKDARVPRHIGTRNFLDLDVYFRARLDQLAQVLDRFLALAFRLFGSHDFIHPPVVTPCLL
jgi:hypothetical protein